MKLRIGIRPAVESDVPYIVDSWVRSMRDQEPWKYIHPPLLWENLRPRVASLLARSSTLVVHPEESEAHIVGWACAEPGLLHFVYVSKIYRQDGIATKLVEQLVPVRPFEYTHHTRPMVSLARKWGGRFNPYRGG